MRSSRPASCINNTRDIVTYNETVTVRYRSFQYFYLYPTIQMFEITLKLQEMACHFVEIFNYEYNYE